VLECVENTPASGQTHIKRKSAQQLLLLLLLLLLLQLQLLLLLLLMLMHRSALFRIFSDSTDAVNGGILLLPTCRCSVSPPLLVSTCSSWNSMDSAVLTCGLCTAGHICASSSSADDRHLTLGLDAMQAAWLAGRL
jgi:hypothetical protein